MLNYDKDRVKYPVIYDNKFGITDFEKWSNMEFDKTTVRVAKLLINPSLVKRTFDAEHLFALHKYIFQDCYKWAGQMRDNGGQTHPHSWSKTKTIDGKRYTSIYTPDGFLLDRLDEIGATVRKWRKADGKYTKEEMLNLLGNVSDTINELHLFREGNSRCKREFLRELADENGYSLDFGKIEVKALSNGEFIANCDYCDNANISKMKYDRAQILKDLYAPLLFLRAAVAKKPKCYGESKRAAEEEVEE